MMRRSVLASASAVSGSLELFAKLNIPLTHSCLDYSLIRAKMYKENGPKNSFNMTPNNQFS